MEISPIDARNTLLELFARRGLVEGDVVWLSRLETFWATTPLRRSDLVVGICQLSADEMVVVEELDDETCLSLTPVGEEMAAEILRAGAGSWGRYLKEELLPGVRFGAKVRPSSGGGRRAYEADPE